MTFFYAALAIICVLAISAGQILFKLTGASLQAGAGIFSPRVLATFAAAGVIYALATLLWIYLLRFVPLNKAYVFMSLSFLLVPVAAHFLLGEPISMSTITSAILIFLGIVISVGFR